MKKCLAVLCFIFSLVCVNAQAGEFRHCRNSANSDPLTILDGVALNATPATRTMTVTSNGKWDKLKLGIIYTRSNASAITVTFTCSYGSGRTKLQPTSRSITDGASTSNLLTDSIPVTGDVNAQLEFDVFGCYDISFLLGGTGADGSDLVDTECQFVRNH